jgi:hypothetical protein
MTWVHGTGFAWHAAFLAALGAAGFLVLVHAVRDHKALDRVLWRASDGGPPPAVPPHHHWFAQLPAASRWAVSAAWGLAALAVAVTVHRYAGIDTAVLTAADSVAAAVLFRPDRDVRDNHAGGGE